MAKLIEHPVDDEIVLCNGSPAWFAAYGFAPANCPCVRAKLKDKDGKRVGRAILLCGPSISGFWSVALVGVPRDRHPYSLELWDEDKEQILGKSKGIKIMGYKGTFITYPDSGQTVPTSFTSYGSTDKSSVTAQMTGHGTTNVAATINGSGWFAVFQGIQTANNWTLNALEGQNITDTKQRIVVH